jgi:hypothetical protein
MLIFLARGSAIDITWRHWATLVQDLEEIAEKNRQEASKQGSSANSAVKDDDGKAKPEPKYHWERRPTWQRGMFCGIYVAGWCFSTLYLLKYRQTFVTSMKLFRGPKELPSISKQSIPTPSEVAVPESTSQPKLQRMVHLQTAGNEKGVELPLNELIVQDGRNETELVIRQTSSRNYWYVSLTDSLVNGQKFSTETGRERMLAAWQGKGVQENKPAKPLGGGWKSGPVTR